MIAAKEIAEDVANEAIPSTPTPLILPSPQSHDIPSTTQVQSSPPQQSQSSPQAPPQGAEFPTHLFQQVLDTCSALTRRVENLEHDKAAQKLEIIKLKARGRMIDDLDKDKRIELVVDQVKDADTAKTEGRHAAEQTEKQAEIYHLDLDHPSNVLSMQKDDSEVQEVVEVVTTAKLITKVVTASTSQVSAASATISAAKPSIPAAAPTGVAAYTRRRKGLIIKDLEEELSSKPSAETPKLKDKGKGILIETPKPIKKKDQIELDAEYARKLHEEINKDHKEINKDIDWDAEIDHVKQKSKENPQYIKRYQVMKKRPQTESEARKNIMIYLKNTAGYKLDFFKGMLYDEIRLFFKLAAKRRKLNEEAQEVEDLKKHLEVVDDEDDDLFTEATPLARKEKKSNNQRSRRGIILKTPAETPKLKDKGKGILVETSKPMKKKDQIELDAEYARKLHEEINRDHKEINKDIDWDAAIDHVNQKSKNPHYIKRYQGMKKRPQTESEARKNMMIYLKNTAGYKMDFFKGMTYAEICPIFQARFDENLRFLFKSRKEIKEED
nr:hypothetical protein [Tanacetum cinerariifolium]